MIACNHLYCLCFSDDEGEPSSEEEESEGEEEEEESGNEDEEKEDKETEKVVENVSAFDSLQQLNANLAQLSANEVTSVLHFLNTRYNLFV